MLRQLLLPYPTLSVHMNLVIAWGNFGFRHPALSTWIKRVVSRVVNSLMAPRVLHVPMEGEAVEGALPAQPKDSVRVVVISDTHQLHETMWVPPGDVLVHAGDLLVSSADLEAQLTALHDVVAWLRRHPHACKVVIGGNHDRCLDPRISTETAERAKAVFGDGVTFLHPEQPMVEASGLRIAGCSYSFRASPEKPLSNAFQFPDAWVEPPPCDVLVTHGPPGHLLGEPDDGKGQRGAQHVLAAVEQRIRPRLHAFGHAHIGYGVERRGRITFANCSSTNGFWMAIHRPVVVDLARPPPPVRLAVLNPNDGNVYNAQVMRMLRELLGEVGARITLEELNLCNSRLVDLIPLLPAYDGVILPGSPESCAAGSYAGQEAPSWIRPLEMLLRQIHAKRRPMLGICFGHQLLASALGGRVEVNARFGVQAGACTFDLTALGSSILGAPTEAAGGLPAALPSAAASATLQLLYHHGDVVVRLPTCAANLGCSATNPTHAAAYFCSAPVARAAVTRGRLAPDSTDDAASSTRPCAFTVQAHPEFATPSGTAVLGTLLRRHSSDFSEEWVAEKLATVGSAASKAASHQVVRAAVKVLWPQAMV